MFRYFKIFEPNFYQNRLSSCRLIVRRRLNVDVDIASPPKNFDNFEQKKIQTFYFGQGVEFYSQLFLLDFFSFGIRL